ncbi:leucine-rich repeat and coiled-coil domain-containing protein 1 [Chanos chanos]|uniref:Leucine-rich repeat and coiled-coil domain-containing protein 1 n=1 Tax=Chanos chanos TaxID=29144 RepID=A0A6J2VD92_CHACN|nr:leucine-rich repeat and coiled-coil domain-containing protein 1 [Chanos chanos]
MADRELCLIDKDISSLLEVPLNSRVTSLNLHCNQIKKIEGLTTAWHIRHLDLSSNHISHIEGLGCLSSLRTLNLSCNLITRVEGLNGLVNLTRLNLSYNKINDLTGLLYLHGPGYKLKQLHLQSNHVDSMNHMLQCMVGLQNLRNVTLYTDDVGNPVCAAQGYREIVLQSLKQITTLDGVGRLGNPVPSEEDDPVDVPGLEDFLEFLVSSDAEPVSFYVKSDAPLTTPRIDEVLTQFRQRTEALAETGGPVISERLQPDPDRRSSALNHQNNELRIEKLEQQVSQLFHKASGEDRSNLNVKSSSAVRKAKRDTDLTSESENDSGKENQHRATTPARPRSSVGKKPTRLPKGKPKSDSESEDRKWRGSKAVVNPQRRTAAQRAGSTQDVGASKKGVKTSKAKRSANQTEEDTYRAIVEERDQERERRWKAEQAVKRLTDQVKSLQTRASEEKELQSMALHTTDRLKEVLLKERSDHRELQSRVEELEERWRTAAEQLEQAQIREDQHKRALRSLEDAASRGEALRAQQQAEEMKRNQELEKKAAALKRETEILRASLRQHKDKLQQLHELLAAREQDHRKELELRLVPGGPEFREAVAREVEVVEQKHAERLAVMEQKIADSQKQYADLEDEFRMALTIEASRLSEVKEGFDQVSAELTQVKVLLTQSQQRERQSGSLVQELTTMVKEQKIRITELIKAKRESVSELKARIQSLEAGAEENKHLGLQVELLRKDKSRLLSQLTAQESVVDGLRAERKIWGQELAQQGASLAQDRGRLEARIEVLSTELETQKKQNERDNDALRIKAKIVDDQTETIRKLKEALQERDEQIRKLREENLQAQRQFQQQLEEETAPLLELRDRVEQLTLRKEELKEQLQDKETELDEIKEAYRASNKKWQDKADLLTKLESQVKRMKEGFDTREKALVEERDKASKAHKAAVEKLHAVDDAFRKQLESLQVSHQAELLSLASEKERQIELANQRVLEVEDEMRQLLLEMENNKRTMEEKMRRLTNVLREF